jgi:Protein-L-isoaspartate(D-aspartate) O-methyltransferase (PCMT)
MSDRTPIWGAGSEPSDPVCRPASIAVVDERTQPRTVDVTRDARSATRKRELTRKQMVETQVAARGVRDARVLEAMGEVPREVFVTSGLEDYAHDDRALPIDDGRTTATVTPHEDRRARYLPVHSLIAGSWNMAS